MTNVGKGSSGDSNAGGGLHISHPFIRGKPHSISVGMTSFDTICVHNTTKKPIPLRGMNIFCSKPAGAFTLSTLKPPSLDSDEGHIQRLIEEFSLDDRIVQPQSTLNLWLSCKPNGVGLHTFIVHFDIGKDRIELVVFLLAEDEASRSFSRALRRNQFRYKLLEFEIPKETRKLLESGQIPTIVTECLTMDNYAAYFNTLLNMEELHLERDMRKYDMKSISMQKRSKQFVLAVSGLAERRPSLVPGDFVVVDLVDQARSTPSYQGSIYRIEANEVRLRFNKKFHKQHQPHNLYNVRFTQNRVTIRRLHQAVQQTESLDSSLLIPSQSTAVRSNGRIGSTPLTHLNEQQQRCIDMILSCRGGPPYVIYGPPGTGKTLTVVEAILQIYKTRKSARILVCAASNTAADDVLQKLVGNKTAKVKEHEVFRLNAKSRKYEDVQPSNTCYSYFEDNIFRCPPINALLCYKIIISTYMSSSLLYANGITRGHFSHIFLDEAGQVSEPDAMVPLSGLCQRETVVVLAGDPKQLGPVVFSRDAMTYGLGKSYLERLFESTHYQAGDENFITKLVKNYRCHPAILELPSKLFYEGELVACKNDNSSDKSWLKILPNQEFPVLFVGIEGCDERERANPSWFNQIEVNKVVKMIKRLRASTGLRESDIGVITPYRQQVAKITKALELLGLNEIKVGSVEQFQGQEREVIIVSTVRSTLKHQNHDNTNCLGFLSNPRRFNVAVTRAKSLLIIVGNPHIINKDRHWGSLLSYCCENGSYIGCPLPKGMIMKSKSCDHKEEKKPKGQIWKAKDKV